MLITSVIHRAAKSTVPKVRLCIGVGLKSAGRSRFRQEHAAVHGVVKFSCSVPAESVQALAQQRSRVCGCQRRSSSENAHLHCRAQEMGSWAPLHQLDRRTIPILLPLEAMVLTCALIHLQGVQAVQATARHGDDTSKRAIAAAVSTYATAW